MKASKFNQGFINTEYLAASLLDMDWHTLSSDQELKDVNDFETKSMTKYGLIDEIARDTEALISLTFFQVVTHQDTIVMFILQCSTLMVLRLLKNQEMCLIAHLQKS